MAQSVYGGTGDQSQYGSGYGSNYGSYPTQSGQYQANGSGSSQQGSRYQTDEGYVTPEQWREYIATQKAALAASSGFARVQLQAQIDDAQKALDNAYKIAQLQGDNQRYGYDQQRQTAIDQLKENARQYDRTHELDVKKQDLSEAQYISDQRSKNNRLFQTMDLEQALTSIRSGNRATTSTNVAAVDGLSTDYTGNPYLSNSGGSSSSGGTTYSASGTSSNTAGSATTSATSSSGQDPRTKAARAVMDALPPSATTGLDSSAVAALNAVYHLYNAPLRQGTLESLSPTQQATLQSGSERIKQYTGKSYDDLMSEYANQAPRSAGVRAA